MALLLAPATFAYPQPAHVIDQALTSQTTTDRQTPYWETSQPCNIKPDTHGRCVEDGEGDYANNEHCQITAVAPGFYAEFTEFHLEPPGGDANGEPPYDHDKCDDYITLQGVKYCGANKPGRRWYEGGEVITFTSDWAKDSVGFVLCAEGGLSPSSPPPSPPVHPSPPPTPPPPLPTRYEMKAEGSAPCIAHPIKSKDRCIEAAHRLFDGHIVNEGGICSTGCTYAFKDDSTDGFENQHDTAEDYPNGCYYYNDKHDSGDGSGGMVRWNPQWDEHDGIADAVVTTVGHANAHPICIYVEEDGLERDDSLQIAH